MSEFRIAVAAARPAVVGFFAEMARENPEVVVMRLPLDADAAAQAGQALDDAVVAVVDASVDATDALEVFEAIRAQRPTLPVGVVFCCPHSAKAHRLRAFVAAGASGFLDLRLPMEEQLSALRSLARGRGVFHLQLAEGSGASLSEALGSTPRTDLSDHDIGLLNLIKLGLTDGEIGRQLYLSPHTVKHHIERLRRRAQARNRVQLAAWAAHHDVLRSGDGGSADSDA
jgi:DNA-binding NarL/FixJ family response regulator